MTPLEVHNPPGRDVLAHRVGTHADFLSTMLARLSGPAHPALRGLTVRDPGDPAVALLDAWAVLADLTDFHSERIAAERYLRTATDPAPWNSSAAWWDTAPAPGSPPPPSSPTPSTTTRARRGPGRDGPRRRAVDQRARAGGGAAVLRDRRGPAGPLVVERDGGAHPPPPPAHRGPAARTPGTVPVGTANNVRPGDRLLFVFSAEKSADPGQRVLLTVPHVRVDRALGTTAVGLPGPELPSLAALLEELQRWITPGGDAPNPRPQDSPVVSASTRTSWGRCAPTWTCWTRPPNSPPGSPRRSSGP
ncbi:hypothetical protein GQS52_03870 [Streptomyces sp. SCUT-3]|uniref:hypothetical protein n=1 Tax=Streptomyces sp. SCUT-3 TaxID=2684469 RepID=UPI0015FC1198|nr:hypothetical protein [Streptomyces sp. SCUT-3]QMV21054.1 hypothetical protein GQS52_03870 [Streptomyces sp. SCUT-3]